MCGIVGRLNTDRSKAVAPELIRQMCQTLVHRGPDDEGIHVEGPVGIGMRRLSIIDLAGGHQPISNEDGTIWVVLNGEIYNYRDWRPLLESILPSAVHIGAAGDAMMLKLVANLLVALNSAAVAEALAMAGRGGLDPARVVEVLQTGAATSRMLDVRGPMMASGEFPAQMKLDLFMKDLHLIQEAAGSVGARLPLTDVAERLYAAAQAAGHGGEDLAVVITELGAGTR